MRRRWAARHLPAIGLLAAAATILPAGTSSAHSVLISMDPADGSLVTSAPSRVVLTFNSPIQDIGDIVVVIAPSGTHVETGRPAITDDVVTQALTPLTEPGHYTVEYRVTSTDGHPVSRRLGFDYLTHSTPTPTATTTSPATINPSGDGLPLGALLAGVSGLLLVAVVAVLWLARRRHPRPAEPDG